MLYLVSTPIGNLGDLSDRARQTLQRVDLIACEDTRTTKQLLTLLGLKIPPLTAYHEHNADRAKDGLIEKMRAGADIALVSDAGTPLISDPGYKLVRACYENNISVTSVPGANAPLTALQLSGIASNAFCFGGFLPTKRTARQKYLKTFSAAPCTLIFYETANRLIDALADIADSLNNPFMAVVREMTKKFEEVKRGSATDLLAFYEQNGQPKGEIVLVIENSPATQTLSDSEIDEQLTILLKTQSVKQAAQTLHTQTSLSKKELYTRALALKENA